ncbi:MAG: NAD-dependent epimerase/dehydratase family protein, partial [Candidatus Sericytochromatia bacterium]
AMTVENGGIATRDFIYVDDIVTGLIRCAEAGAAGEVYNLASGEETSILDLANLINELTGNPTVLDFRPKRSWDHSGKRFGSPEKSTRELDFRVQTSLREGLGETIAWTREHLPLIKACMARHAAHMA